MPTTGGPPRASSDKATDEQGTGAAQAEQAADQDKDQATFLRPGQVYDAVVDAVHPDAILVHLTESQRKGFVPARYLKQLDPGFRSALEEGDRVPVRVLKDPGSAGDVVVSLDQEATGQDSSADQDWARAEELLRIGEVFEARVTSFNQGGVVVAFGHLEGFVPNSHLERRGRRDRESKDDLVGQTLSLVVLEIDRPKRRLVLSQRAIQGQNKEQTLAQLQRGQVHTGVVRNLVPFGAFVDLGGVDGLIHISELDWRHVEHPSEVLQVGDEVEVYVLDVDRKRSRISLSRKYLLPRPWDQAEPVPGEPSHASAPLADGM
jgi:small subunit ribosomal protein S1